MSRTLARFQSLACWSEAQLCEVFLLQFHAYIIRAFHFRSCRNLSVDQHKVPHDDMRKRKISDLLLKPETMLKTKFCVNKQKFYFSLKFSICIIDEIKKSNHLQSSQYWSYLYSSLSCTFMVKTLQIHYFCPHLQVGKFLKRVKLLLLVFKHLVFGYSKTNIKHYMNIQTDR